MSDKVQGAATEEDLSDFEVRPDHRGDVWLYHADGWLEMAEGSVTGECQWVPDAWPCPAGRPGMHVDLGAEILDVARAIEEARKQGYEAGRHAAASDILARLAGVLRYVEDNSDSEEKDDG